MSTINLSRLDSEEFADELSESVWDDELWAPFLAADVVDRTRVALTDMAAHVQSQMSLRDEAEDREWRRRAKNFLRRVQSRITEANVAIKDRNRAESATAESMSRKWGTLALELAQALAESDMAFMLDEITVGDITAAVWLDRRRVIAAAKAVA